MQSVPYRKVYRTHYEVHCNALFAVRSTVSCLSRSRSVSGLAPPLRSATSEVAFRYNCTLSLVYVILRECRMKADKAGAGAHTAAKNRELENAGRQRQAVLTVCMLGLCRCVRHYGITAFTEDPISTIGGIL